MGFWRNDGIDRPGRAWLEAMAILVAGTALAMGEFYLLRGAVGLTATRILGVLILAPTVVSVLRSMPL